MDKGIGKKVRQIRELKGFTQEYLADQLGISQRAYSKLERDETKLDWDKITRIAQVFEIDPLDLVSFDDNLIFHNCNQSGKIMHSTLTNIPDKLIEQYEGRITQLQEEVSFLREELRNARK